MSREALIEAAKLIAALAEEVADLRADAADFDKFAADAYALLTRAQHAEAEFFAEHELRVTFQGEAERAEATLAKVAEIRDEWGALNSDTEHYALFDRLDDVLNGSAS